LKKENKHTPLTTLSNTDTYEIEEEVYKTNINEEIYYTNRYISLYLSDCLEREYLNMRVCVFLCVHMCLCNYVCICMYIFINM